jgi:hypothetical protein
MARFRRGTSDQRRQKKLEHRAFDSLLKQRSDSFDTPSNRPPENPG